MIQESKICILELDKKERIILPDTIEHTPCNVGLILLQRAIKSDGKTWSKKNRAIYINEWLTYLNDLAEADGSYVRYYNHDAIEEIANQLVYGESHIMYYHSMTEVPDEFKNHVYISITNKLTNSL